MCTHTEDSTNTGKAFGLKLSNTEYQSDLTLILAIKKEVSHDFI